MTRSKPLTAHPSGLFNAAGKPICGAKTTKGTPCQSPVLMDNGRCRIHGGATPSGLASPNTKTGKYSKNAPTRLTANYQDALSDQKLMELREEVALLDAYIMDRLSRADHGDSGQLWRLLDKTYRDHYDAIYVQADPAKISATITELRRLIQRGIADHTAWAEILEAIEQRRRLVESERKHMIQMEQLVSVEQMMLVAAQLLDSVRKNVTDRQQLGAITTEFTRILQG